jgi:hypothetical protein
MTPIYGDWILRLTGVIDSQQRSSCKKKAGVNSRDDGQVKSSLARIAAGVMVLCGLVGGLG